MQEDYHYTFPAQNSIVQNLHLLILVSLTSKCHRLVTCSDIPTSNK